MTVKKDETRLNIAKHRYGLMMSNWGELNHKHRALLHVNVLALSAFVVYLGFVIDSVTSFMEIPILQFTAFCILLSLFSSLAFIVISISKLLDSEKSEIYIDMTIEFPEKYADSMTEEYETVCGDINDKCNKLNKNTSSSIRLLVASLITLFVSVALVFVTKIQVQTISDSINDMICEAPVSCLLMPT